MTDAASLTTLGAPVLSGYGRKPVWTHPSTASAVARNVERARLNEPLRDACAAKRRNRSFAHRWPLNLSGYKVGRWLAPGMTNQKAEQKSRKRKQADASEERSAPKRMERCTSCWCELQTTIPAFVMPSTKGKKWRGVQPGEHLCEVCEKSWRETQRPTARHPGEEQTQQQQKREQPTPHHQRKTEEQPYQHEAQPHRERGRVSKRSAEEIEDHETSRPLATRERKAKEEGKDRNEYVASILQMGPPGGCLIADRRRTHTLENHHRQPKRQDENQQQQRQPKLQPQQHKGEEPSQRQQDPQQPRESPPPLSQSMWGSPRERCEDRKRRLEEIDVDDVPLPAVTREQKRSNVGEAHVTSILQMGPLRECLIADGDMKPPHQGHTGLASTAASSGDQWSTPRAVKERKKSNGREVHVTSILQMEPIRGPLIADGGTASPQPKHNASVSTAASSHEQWTLAAPATATCRDITCAQF